MLFKLKDKVLVLRNYKNKENESKNAGRDWQIINDKEKRRMDWTSREDQACSYTSRGKMKDKTRNTCKQEQIMDEQVLSLNVFQIMLD